MMVCVQKVHRGVCVVCVCVCVLYNRVMFSMHNHCVVVWPMLCSR